MIGPRDLGCPRCTPVGPVAEEPEPDHLASAVEAARLALRRAHRGPPAGYGYGTGLVAECAAGSGGTAVFVGSPVDIYHAKQVVSSIGFAWEVIAVLPDATDRKERRGTRPYEPWSSVVALAASPSVVLTGPATALVRHNARMGKRTPYIERVRYLEDGENL